MCTDCLLYLRKAFKKGDKQFGHAAMLLAACSCYRKLFHYHLRVRGALAGGILPVFHRRRFYDSLPDEFREGLLPNGRGQA